MFPEQLHAIQQDIRVNYRYGVHFTRNLFAPANPLVKDLVSTDASQLPVKLLAVVDRGVHRHHPQLLKNLQVYFNHYRLLVALAGHPLLFEGGEVVKNDPLYVTIVHQAIEAAGLCRHSYIMAIGGGALIDMVGFAAATAHRGIRLIRVPTTVMAQADASIGVKNSINAFGKKNFVGTFAPPAAVINDAGFLTTLSQRDWIGGVAEAVKVALIKDEAFFNLLEETAASLADRDLEAMQQVVHRTAALHLEHIAGGGDPFECGSSRPLDFGHWAAHKLEQLSAFELGHGQAVAVGLALDATYSYLTRLLPKNQWQRIIATLEKLGLATYVPELEAEENLLAGLNEFREHLGGPLTVMLLRDIGQGVEVHNIDPKLVRASVNLLKKNAAAPLRFLPLMGMRRSQRSPQVLATPPAKSELPVVQEG